MAWPWLYRVLLWSCAAEWGWGREAKPEALVAPPRCRLECTLRVLTCSGEGWCGDGTNSVSTPVPTFPFLHLLEATMAALKCVPRFPCL